MVERVNGQNNGDGYGKITLRNTRTNEKTTYLIPMNKQVEIGGNKYDMSKAKNGEIIINGDPSKDPEFKLTGWALEHLDTNKDGKIDKKDSSQDIASDLNKNELKNTKYYIKQTDFFADAGITEGEGIVVFSKENEGQIHEVYIGDKE